MPKIVGNIRKMSAVFKAPVEYKLPVGSESVVLNPLVGSKIQLHYLGEIHCIQCSRKTSKSFHQGYCFPCYRKLLECDLCSIHPEKCRFYEGVCSTDDWAHSHCGQPHVVYLANSSGLKVGITRASHIPSRWIDQGATQGLVIMKVQNRYQAGVVEAALKQYVADKTNWQAMLKKAQDEMDLFQKRGEILTEAEAALHKIKDQFAQDEIKHALDEKMQSIQYPILAYPEKIKAFDLEKNPLVEGVLMGLKGQYLMLDTGVINIRKFAGYFIEFVME